MRESEIEGVASVLDEWNPLGPKAQHVPDLDCYRTEAIDIISVLRTTGGAQPAEAVVMQVLNQAFRLGLTLAECEAPAQKIIGILAVKHQLRRDSNADR